MKFLIATPQFAVVSACNIISIIMLTNGAFNLHFLNDIKLNNFSYVICHVIIQFKLFTHFGYTFFFIYICTVNVFFCFVSLSFISLIIAFKQQKFLILKKSNLTNDCFMHYSFSNMSKET